VCSLGDVHLVIVGERSPSCAAPAEHHSNGYVDDATRWEIVRGSTALINPSLYESLSLVLLEAWTVGRPVVVNARCDVTADLVRRSGGGLVVDFEDPDGAAAVIAAGLEHEDQRDEFGRRGEVFAGATFVWDRVLDEYEMAAKMVAHAGSL
jgi:glycosyltransferase involved in cell wall biosynthesis